MSEIIPEIPVTDEPQLASRMSRFWAVLIDSFIAIGTSFALLYFIDFDIIPTSSEGFSPMNSVLLLLYGWGMFLLCHGYLLYKNGQTIGKWVFDISIVKLDDSKIEFTPLLLKRYLPISLVSNIPVVGVIVTLADGLFIFRKDRRCIHDLIAGTKVVQLDNKTELSDKNAKLEC